LIGEDYGDWQHRRRDGPWSEISKPVLGGTLMHHTRSSCDEAGVTGVDLTADMFRGRPKLRQPPHIIYIPMLE